MNLSDLDRPFTEKDLEWRIGMAGLKKNGEPWAQILCYVDARAIMNRFDKVCGKDGWMDEYEILPTGVKCRLSIKIGDEWVSKQDGSPATKIESFKGGISKALVRTAVKWGAGRSLYDLPVTYATICDKSTPGANFGTGKDSNGKQFTFYWIAPQAKQSK